MIIFPAIDVLDNQAVRLLYGQRQKVTIYGTPVEMALKWQEMGGEYLHLVDLNGAFDDSLVNKKTLKEVINNCKIPVQLGGGVKSLDKIKFYIQDIGVTRVIVGTACVTNPKLMDEACKLFGNKIVAGIDAKEGKVAIKGWVETCDILPIQVATQMKERGVDTIVYTDISRDGALTGVNLQSTVELSQKSQMNVIASGGMASLQDVRAVKNNGLYGAILGRSIYDGIINLSDAVAISKE